MAVRFRFRVRRIVRGLDLGCNPLPQAALRKILENPNADRLSLKQMDLVDVKPLCDRLSTMANLRSLDLSGNRLANLPANMSKLRSLQTLDVTQNMFPSLSSVLPVLQTLPSLNELLISASDEEEEQLLMALPRLVSLNGVDLAGEQMPPPPPQQQQQQQPQPPPQQASSSDGAGAPGIFNGGQETSGMTPREVTLTKVLCLPGPVRSRPSFHKSAVCSLPARFGVAFGNPTFPARPGSLGRTFQGHQDPSRSHWPGAGQAHDRVL